MRFTFELETTDLITKVQERTTCEIAFCISI